MKKPVKFNIDGSPIILVSENPEDIQKALMDGFELIDCEIGYDGSFYLKGQSPKLDIETARSLAMSRINVVYENMAISVKSDTPDSEIATWNIQKDEAEKWKNDNKSPTPFIDALALGRKVDREVLLSKVLEKSNAFNLFIANLTGQRQFYEDRIKEAQTVEEVEAVVWEE